MNVSFYYAFTQLLHHKKNMTWSRSLNGIKLVWIQIFPFSLIGCRKTAEEFSLPYYLSIVEEKTGSFMPFLRVLARSETQITSYWIWNLVADSISNDDDLYAKRAY